MREGNKWRIIITDTESESGVAPQCPNTTLNDSTVNDCCPGPHLECWTPDRARQVCDLLNALVVEVCQ